MKEPSKNYQEMDRRSGNDVEVEGDCQRPWWQALLLGIVAGSGGSLIGVGGGIIMVPIMTLWGMSQKRAQGTSLLVILALVPVAIISYWHLDNIDFTFAVPLAIGGTIGGLAGSTIANRFSNRVLAKAFGVLLILISIRMLFMPDITELATSAVLSTAGYLEAGLFGLLAGTVAGFFGVGGGVVFVPTGVLLAGLPQVIAQGSSLTAMFPTSLAGSLAYRHKRQIDLALAKWIVPGAWMGVLAGSWGADILSGSALRIIFAIFLFINGLRRVLIKDKKTLDNVKS